MASALLPACGDSASAPGEPQGGAPGGSGGTPTTGPGSGGAGAGTGGGGSGSGGAQPNPGTGAGGSPSDGSGAGPGSRYRISGTVVDFLGDRAITGSAAVTAVGVVPAPSVSVTGTGFEIGGIPPHSVVHVLGSVPPTHVPTYAALLVEDRDVSAVRVRVLAADYLARLRQSFQPQASDGATVVARAVDAMGRPVAGVRAGDLALNGAAQGPYFLDEMLAPRPDLTATTASGYVVFFGVAQGTTAVTGRVNGGVSVISPELPAAADAVTLLDFIVQPATTPPPANISFSRDVVPLFERRGCAICHSGSNIGQDLGNLALSGGDPRVYRETTEELSPNYNRPRIDRMSPEASILLTLPSFELPADRHPNATFTSRADPDYVILLTWIREGARMN